MSMPNPLSLSDFAYGVLPDREWNELPSKSDTNSNSTKVNHA